MRCPVSAAFLTGMLIILCLTGGCTIPFFGETQDTPAGVNAGINTIEKPVDAVYLSFSDATAGLKENFPGSALLRYNENISIYYIQATQFDASGNAARWMYGVNVSSGARLMILDNGYWTEIPWESRLPQQEIPVDRVITPEKLFSQNKDAIFADPAMVASDITELDLREGAYTLTITTNGVTRYLTFDAISGEPVVLR